MTPEPVAESLKQRFAEWIDKRTERGVAKYGHPLSTFNGRDAGQDAMEELLDFCQYQQQRILELEAQVVWFKEEMEEPGSLKRLPQIDYEDPAKDWPYKIAKAKEARKAGQQVRK